VAGQSSLERIVRSLAAVCDVVVAVAEEMSDDVAAVLSAPDVPAVRLTVAAAPGRRRECLAAGLAGLHDGPVLVHDIGWPIFSQPTLEGVLGALHRGADAVLPICAVTDSIKAVDGRGVITATVDRAPLRTVQFPRGFSAAMLAQLIGTSDFDDELETVLTGGDGTVLIDGDTAISRIELPCDAAYLDALLTSRDSDPAR
jgi:2-C-methyl-D-erythritol 4-phosphate cytidylyltransferase